MFVPLRGRAVAARRAHNPEVSGSNPLPATIFQTTRNGRFWFNHAFDPFYEVVDTNTLQIYFRDPIRLLNWIKIISPVFPMQNWYFVEFWNIC
jgi:hypothetical protein